jgi:hypothetical protein
MADRWRCKQPAEAARLLGTSRLQVVAGLGTDLVGAWAAIKPIGRNASEC